MTKVFSALLTTVTKKQLTLIYVRIFKKDAVYFFVCFPAPAFKLFVKFSACSNYVIVMFAMFFCFFFGVLVNFCLAISIFVFQCLFCAACCL